MPAEHGEDFVAKFQNDQEIVNVYYNYLNLIGSYIPPKISALYKISIIKAYISNNYMSTLISVLILKQNLNKILILRNSIYRAIEMI